ncbi:MAG: hypothetical protein ACREMY_16040, partial [bacterium]
MTQNVSSLMAFGSVSDFYKERAYMVSEASRRQRTTPASAASAVSDFAAHPLAMAVPLVDGQAAMLAMCVAFLQARTS